LHEIGEIRASKHLRGWDKMMVDLMFTQAEIMARAVRDHLADAIATLPVLVENHQEASIHFYVANLTNMRKHIFPSLIAAYDDWLETGDISKLQRLIDDSRDHWKNIGHEMLALYNEHGENSHQRIETLVENNKL